MYLIEIAAQGVRGFSPSCRAAVKTGYFLLKPPAAAQAPLCGLAQSVLYSDGRGADAAFLLPGLKAGKVGFTLLGNDQITYRLVRDLGGSGALQRFDKASSKFEIVTDDTNEMAQFLKAQVGFPPKSAFENLFCLTAQQLPTQARPKARPAEKLAPEKPRTALQSSASVEAANDVPAARAKLAELKRELTLSKDVEEIQFKIDGLASQTFELEQSLQQLEGLKSKLKEGQAAFEGAPTPEQLQLPEDILAQLERYPTALARRDEALAKLAAERETGEISMAPGAPEPLWTDQRFLAGAGVGTLALIAGALLTGWAKYVALLDIPAFGLSALVALQYVDNLQGSKRATNKGGRREAREKKIRDQFEAEGFQVKRALVQLNVETPEEAIAVLARKGLLNDKLQQLREELSTLEMDPRFAAASAKYQSLKAEQEALNAALLEKGGSYFRDTREVERELARVQESIQLAEKAGRGGETGAPSELEDPTPALLALAADLFNTDVAGVVGMVKERSLQYLAALTDKRCQGLEFDREGRITAHVGGRALAAPQMSGKDLDVAYLSVKLTVLEKYSARFKIPVLIDDGPYVDDLKLPLLGRMLKHLGTLTQVLHVTGAQSLVSVADGTANL